MIEKYGNCLYFKYVLKMYYHESLSKPSLSLQTLVLALLPLFEAALGSLPESSYTDMSTLMS